MKKVFLLFALSLLSISTATALEPLKVAIFKTGGAANVQVVLNDYTGGTATAIYTGTPVSLTPNSSGIIIINVANNTATTDWADITAAQVNSYYVLDIKVGGTLYAQYRLDQQIINQSQGGVLDSEGNLTPPETGTASVGSDDNRWDGLYVTGNTLHVGPAGGMAGNDELAFSYDDATNTATMTVAGASSLTATAAGVTVPGTLTVNGNTTLSDEISDLVKVNSRIEQVIGDNNIAIGKEVYNTTATGARNLVLGYQTLQNINTGSNNVALGYLTAISLTSGHNNVIIGYSSGVSLTSGRNNVFLGSGTGNYITDGEDNIFLGRSAGGKPGQKADAMNTVAIGLDVLTTADNQVVIGNGSITETQLNGKLQNDVTTATHTQLSTANTSVIKYTEGTDVATGNLPTATNGTFLYIYCTNAVTNFLGSSVVANDVVSCVRIDGTWRRVK